MKNKLPYIIAIFIVILGLILVGVNEDLGSILGATGLMFMAFYPLFKIAVKKEKTKRERKNKVKQAIDEHQKNGLNGKAICKNCGSTKTEIQIVNERKNTGFLMIVLYFILFITLIGWLVLIPILLINRNKTKTYRICQDCGNLWN